MSPWLFAIIAGLIVALVQYGLRDWRLGGGIIAAFLRFLAITIIVALILDAAAAPAKVVGTWAALDASASMARGDTSLWRAARDTIARLRAESVFVFGDSARRGDTITAPRDVATLLRPAVERALGAGHPLVVVTDGELERC